MIRFAASVAFLAILSAPALAADPLDPEAMPDAEWAPHFYVALGAGASFQPDLTWEYVDQDHTYRFDTGFKASGAAGVYLPWNFRAEVEGAYRENEAHRDDTSLGGLFNVSGPIEAVSVTGNLLHDFDMGRFGVFAGGGVGWTHIDVDIEWDDGVFTFADGSDDRFSYQLKAGATVDLSRRLKLVGEYSFLDTLDDGMTLFNTGVGITAVEAPYYNHSATLGLRLDF